MTIESPLHRDRRAANPLRNRFRVPLNELKWIARRVNLPFASALDQDVVCRKCRWKCSRRSRCKSRLDMFLGLFLLQPFRCRSCHRRYYRLVLGIQ